MSSKSFFRQLASRSVRSTPAGGVFEAEGGGGNVQIGRNISMEAQVFINTGRGHLAGLNGQDHRGGAGDAVAPGKDPFQPGTLPSSAVTMLL